MAEASQPVRGIDGKAAAELGNAWFELLKNGLIVALIVLFLFWPQVIHGKLATMGVTEFDVLGLKGSTALADVSQELADQRASAKALTERLAQTQALLTKATTERDELAARLGSPATADPALKATVQANAAALAAASATQAKTARTLTENRAAIAEAQRVTAPAGSLWLVVYGADESVDAAMNEVKRVRAAGYQEARVYRRGRWYRPVVEFQSQGAAQEALPAIQRATRYSSGAYIVPRATWCPNATQLQPDLMSCQG